MSWKVYLFIDNKDRINPDDQVYGYVREAEQRVYLFPDHLAHALHDREPFRLQRIDNAWFATSHRFKPVEVEVLELRRIYERTPFKPHLLQQLNHRTVMLIGLGSMGSAITTSLARAGVGTLILADPDVMDIANVSRHEGSLLDIGRPKPDIVRDRVLSINPTLSVETINEDIFAWDDQRLQPLVDRASVLVATTDRMGVQHMSNEQSVLRQRPLVAAGCHDEARSGEVFTWFPHQGLPCYACLRDADAAPAPPPEGRHDYVSHNDDYTGEPGLHAAIAQIAHAAAEAILSVLLAPEQDSELGRVFGPRSQFLLKGTARSAGYHRFEKPFQAWMIGFTAPRRDCVFAGEHAKECSSSE